MARVKRGTTAHAKHKKVIKLARGYRGRARTNYRTAIQRVETGMEYAYRDRRQRKRNFRALWIQRINAAARQHGMSYSQLIHGLSEAGVPLDRKVLADLAVREPAAFKAIVDQAHAALRENV